MKIVVDTNIVFSAILNPSATVGQVIIYGQRIFLILISLTFKHAV
jgi:predicted nucleic acid-binding protein